MLYRYEDYYDATDGDNLTLTLDSAIQSYCESILKKGIEQFEVQDGGFCIAMDPNTGEILAWANSPTFDLNNPWTVSDPVLNQYLEDIKSGGYTKEEAYQKALAEGASSEEARDKAISAAETEVLYTQWANRSISSTYEPGSTFKSIVLAAALEEGVVTENSHFYCPGYIMVEGWSRPISCSKKAPTGMVMATRTWPKRWPTPATRPSSRSARPWVRKSSTTIWRTSDSWRKPASICWASRTIAA